MIIDTGEYNGKEKLSKLHVEVITVTCELLLISAYLLCNFMYDMINMHIIKDVPD